RKVSTAQVSKGPKLPDRESAWVAAMACTYLTSAPRSRKCCDGSMWALLTEDDCYNGTFIPKGTIVMAKVWHLNHDPEIYGAGAAHFNPARCSDAVGEIAQRRICPGKHVANNSLLIGITLTLWGCNIKSGMDKRENVITIDVDGWVEDGLITFRTDSEYAVVLSRSRPTSYSSSRKPLHCSLVRASFKFGNLCEQGASSYSWECGTVLGIAPRAAPFPISAPQALLPWAVPRSQT
ncbi:hypothetical protein BJY52DRAFT_1226521, partial [Lactarius psammicola]